MKLEEANEQLEIIGEEILSVDGFQYLAVIKDESNESDYFIELGYNEYDFDDDIFNEDKHPLFENPIFDYVQPFYSIEGIIEENKLPIRIRPMKSSFEYDCSNKSGVVRKGLGSQYGTIGSFIKLKDEKIKNNLFIISNWHVLMSSSGKIGSSILESKKRDKIGELYWAIDNSHYDIAIAKITDENIYEENVHDFKLGDLAFPNFNNKIMKCGYASGNTKQGIIYSINAYVKVGKANRVYKNQILSEKISFSGDSGSLLVSSNEVDGKHEVYGINFASDNIDFTVSNHLYHIFSKSIPEYTVNNTTFPKVTLNKFI